MQHKGSPGVTRMEWGSGRGSGRLRRAKLAEGGDWEESGINW
jgi:hypothetical protein